MGKGEEYQAVGGQINYYKITRAAAKEGAIDVVQCINMDRSHERWAEYGNKCLTYVCVYTGVCVRRCTMVFVWRSEDNL